MTTQGAALDAAQVQSRVVVIVTVPAPPAAGTDSTELSAVTWHFGVDGPLTETEEEPHAEARTAIVAAANRGHRKKCRTGIGRSHRPCKHLAGPAAGRPFSAVFWPQTILRGSGMSGAAGDGRRPDTRGRREKVHEDVNGVTRQNVVSSGVWRCGGPPMARVGRLAASLHSVRRHGRAEGNRSATRLRPGDPRRWRQRDLPAARRGYPARNTPRVALWRGRRTLGRDRQFVARPYAVRRRSHFRPTHHALLDNTTAPPPNRTARVR
jgi:hypothetical protein